LSCTEKNAKNDLNVPFLILLSILEKNMTFSIRILAVALLSLSATGVYAVSFDCQQASSFVEKAICQNQTLSKLDDELNTLYVTLKEGSKKPEILKKQQLKWLAKIRNACQNDTCLENAYQKRIEALNKMLDKREEAE
jgi:uncharacterized protein